MAQALAQFRSGKKPWCICVFLAVNAGTRGTCGFYLFRSVQGLTTHTQHWEEQVLDCRVGKWDSLEEPLDSLVQLGGHSTLGLSLIFHDAINEAAAFGGCWYYFPKAG